MPKPTTIHDLINTHRQTIEHFAYAPAETEPAAFICQLGDLADHYRDSTLADAADCLSSAVTCLSEALDRADGSPARQEFLQATNKHLYDLAIYIWGVAVTIHEQIVAVEGRIEANTETFVNDSNATHEQRVALTNRIREDAATLRALKQQAEAQR